MVLGQLGGLALARRLGQAFADLAAVLTPIGPGLLADVGRLAGERVELRRLIRRGSVSDSLLYWFSDWFKRVTGSGAFWAYTPCRLWAYTCAFWAYRGAVLAYRVTQCQVVQVGGVTLRPFAVFDAHQALSLQVLDVLANSAPVDLALVGDVLVRRPALALAGLGTGSKGFIMELCTYLVGGPKALKEIAADLLRPVAAKAVAAEQERERDIQECGF